MIDVSGLGVRLRVADAAFRAVISTNAAASALCKVGVIEQEDGELVGLNAELADERWNLRVKPVDVHQGGVEAEDAACLSISPRWAEGLLGQHADIQQQVRIRVRRNRAPEVRALESIDVLGLADVNSALNVRGGRIEQRGLHGVRGHRISVGKHM